MPIAPRDVPDDGLEPGLPTPSSEDEAAGRASDAEPVGTVFAPQDGLSGFVPQVIRERADREAETERT